MKSEWPVALANGWHPIAYASEIKAKPFPVLLMGHPLVVFRGEGGLGVLEDRCPHRNVPLSKGTVAAGVIVCPYHGWEFTPKGICTKVPGAATCPAAAARSFPVIERAGLIWTCLAEKTASFPALPSEIEDVRHDGFWWRLRTVNARILDAIENLLDPMHSYFLHPGLVRGRGNWNPMRVEFTANAKGCDARYTEQRAGMTLLQRLSEGKRTHSYGRYRAPTIVQIAFEDHQGMTATISVIFSPVDEQHTRTFTHFATRKGFVPAWVKRLFIIAFHTPVIAQDQAMLGLQAKAIDGFGAPQFSTGPVDWFGPVIWNLVNGRGQTALDYDCTLVFDHQ